MEPREADMGITPKLRVRHAQRLGGRGPERRGSVLNKSFSATGLGAGEMSRVEDPSLAGTVRGILQIFNSRHPGGNAMDGLQRLLNSYAKPDGTIIPKDFIVGLNDVLVDISMEQSTKVCREVGMSQKGFVLVSALMGYLDAQAHFEATTGTGAEGGERDEDDEDSGVYEESDLQQEITQDHVFTGGNVFGVLDDRNLKDCPTLPAAVLEDDGEEPDELAQEDFSDSDISDEETRAEKAERARRIAAGEEEDEGVLEKVKSAREKLQRDIFKKGKGAPSGKVSRNSTKKRNKYGKIDKTVGKALLNDW